MTAMTNAPPPVSRSPDDAAGDRLDSWKDIAAYLRRDVSTVQRWEKREGMPVRRHLHDKLGSVYAFRSELDDWARGRGARLAQQEATEPGQNGAEQVVSPHRRLVLAAIVLGLLVTIAFAVVFYRTSDGDVRSTAASDGTTTPSAEAQDLLRQARYLSVRTTDADSKSAIALLERAIQLDPAFASAHAELASAYVTRLAYVTPEETRDLEQRAFSAAEKALALDPNVPEAYLARGDLLWTHSHRFAHERAVLEFRKALGLNPKSDQAHRRLARVYVHVGFFEEAIQHANIALANNPSNSQALNTRAQALLWMGRVEEALAILQSIPGPVLPELVEANTVFALNELGRRPEAVAFLQKALLKYPGVASGNLHGIEALLLAESDTRKAQALIASVRQRNAANPSHHSAYFAGCASARMRRTDQAVQWLREAAATGFPCYSLFARDPNLDPIRKDPQFQAFIGEMREQSASLRKALFPAK